MKFVSDFRQVGDFFRLPNHKRWLDFHLPIEIGSHDIDEIYTESDAQYNLYNLLKTRLVLLKINSKRCTAYIPEKS
jgi:hypothetical protein